MTQSGFTKVPNSILQSTKLTGEAKLLFSILNSYNPSHPSYKHLRDLTGWHNRRLTKAITELISSNIIQRNKRFNSSNVYILLDETKWFSVATVEEPLVPQWKTNNTNYINFTLEEKTILIWFLDKYLKIKPKKYSHDNSVKYLSKMMVKNEVSIMTSAVSEVTRAVRMKSSLSEVDKDGLEVMIQRLKKWQWLEVTQAEQLLADIAKR